MLYESFRLHSSFPIGLMKTSNAEPLGLGTTILSFLTFHSIFVLHLNGLLSKNNSHTTN